MVLAALIATVLAGLLHAYVFVLESLVWTGPSARSVFGTTAEEAAATREMAFNQGFYNLFLAVLALAGAVAWGSGGDVVGLTLMAAATGSMAAAALVLFVFSPDKRSAAIKQGTLPVLALILFGLGALV